MKPRKQDQTSWRPYYPSQICYNSQETYRGPAEDQKTSHTKEGMYLEEQDKFTPKLTNEVATSEANLPLMDHPETCGRYGKCKVLMSPRHMLKLIHGEHQECGFRNNTSLWSVLCLSWRGGFFQILYQPANRMLNSVQSVIKNSKRGSHPLMPYAPTSQRKIREQSIYHLKSIRSRV